MVMSMSPLACLATVQAASRALAEWPPGCREPSVCGWPDGSRAATARAAPARSEVGNRSLMIEMGAGACVLHIKPRDIGLPRSLMPTLSDDESRAILGQSR